MAWGDPQDYWWLRPKEEQNHLQAIQLGAQLRQQAITNALRQKDQELDYQRTGIQVQEYFSKKELQNSMMEGSSVLAKTLAGFKNQYDPGIPEAIYGVMAKYRGLSELGMQALDDHRQALQFKQRQEELVELRLSREQMATNALNERIARREGVEATNSERTAILQQRADTGQMDAESRAEYRDFQKENVNLTHEETARRLAVMESNAATRQQRLNNQIQNLPPEKRDLLKDEIKRLNERADRGEFKQKTSKGLLGTGAFADSIQYGAKYDEERKKILDKYGVSSGPSAVFPNVTPDNPLGLDLKLK